MSGKKILKSIVLGGFLLGSCLFGVKVQAANDEVTVGFWFNDLGQSPGDAAGFIAKIQNEPDTPWDVTPNSKLYWAVQFQNLPVLRKLLDEKVRDVNEVLRHETNNRTTLLEKAVGRGNIKAVKLLIKNGADPNQMIFDCHWHLTSPLKRAVCLSRPNIAKFLLKNGADLHQRYNDGDTLLHEAMAGIPAPDKPLEIVNLLLDQGLDPNEKNDYGQVPLVYLVHEILCMTCYYFSCFNYPDDIPVEWAENTLRDINYTFKILKLLVRRGADINAQDDDGRTPLHWAIMPIMSPVRHIDKEESDEILRIYKHLNLKLIKTLIKHGADVNIKNGDGDTPLGLFARRKRLIKNERDLEAMILLRKHGAEANRYHESSDDEFTTFLQSEAEDETQNGDEEKNEDSGSEPEVENGKN
jgi:ankyrin repeat protein